MKTSKTLSCVGMLLIFLLSSCSKDKPPQAPQAFTSECLVLKEEGPVAKSYQYHYSDDGLLESIEYFSNGTFIRETKLVRDDFNRVIRLNKYHSAGALNSFTEVSYEGDSELVTMIEYVDILDYNTVSSAGSTVYENENGRLKKRIYYDPDYVKVNSTLFDYDDELHQFTETYYDADGNFSYQKRTTYDSTIPHPRLHISLLPYFQTFAAVKEEFYDDPSGSLLNTTSSRNITYEIDEENRTIQIRSENFEESDLELIQIEYTCN